MRRVLLLLLLQEIVLESARLLGVCTVSLTHSHHPSLFLFGSDADVVGGTEKYKSVLMEIFYRLKDDPSTAPWMTSIGGGAATTVDNKSNEKPRVSVEEPEEPTLL